MRSLNQIGRRTVVHPNDRLSVTGLEVSGRGFGLVEAPAFPFALVAGASLDVKVQFSPSGRGKFSGSIQVRTAAGQRARPPRLKIDLSGRAIG